MSSYDIAMELLNLDDEEFAEVFAWMQRADYYASTLEAAQDLTRADMIIATDTVKLTGMLKEIVNSNDICPNAWWKSQAKEAFLKNTAEFQQRRLMETAIVINDIYNNLVKKGKIDSGNFCGDIMEVLTDLATEFEYTFFETEEYESDYVGLLEKWVPDRLKEELE